MKQTPFYEIDIALQGRPRLFQIIVIAALHFCFLVLLQSMGEKWEEKPNTNSAKLEKKAPSHILSAKNSETSFPK